MGCGGRNAVLLKKVKVLGAPSRTSESVNHVESAFLDQGCLQGGADASRGADDDSGLVLPAHDRRKRQRSGSLSTGSKR